MPTVTGTSVRGRQTLVATVPNTSADVAIALTGPGTLQSIRYGTARIRVTSSVGSLLHRKEELGTDGFFFTGLPTTTGRTKTVIVDWAVPGINWSVAY